MDELCWLDFALRGTSDRRTVARLDREACRLIQAVTDRVEIRHDYVLKITQKHGVDPSLLTVLPDAIRFGRMIQDRRWHLTFFHADERLGGTWVQATIKDADHGREIWVCTFHAQREAEVRRQCRRHRVIRSEAG